MGSPTVNYLGTGAILLLAYLGVFLESWLTSIRNWLGTQVDLLPVLMVYCGLSSGLVSLTLTAVLAGLWFDALSANPLGISVLPLFLIGFLIHTFRELVLRDQPYARAILGVAACAAAPLCTVTLLWAGGFRPLIGWGSLWQWLVMSLAGGILTPICFWLLDWVHSAFAYSRPTEAPFRPDREIKRGRG